MSNYLDEWLIMKENKIAPTTYSGYKVNIEHIKRFIGDIKLTSLNLLDVQNMLDELSKEGKKHKTVKYVYRTLHAALEYAQKAELVSKKRKQGRRIY